MPHRATDRISRGLRWAGTVLLAAGVLLVVGGIGFTRSAEALITASVVATLAFGVPGAGAFGLALWFEHVADRIEQATDPDTLARAPGDQGNPFREPLRRYAVAVGAVALAWAMRYLLDMVAPGQVPFLTFFLGVIIAGWFGGFGPAALATLLCLVIAWLFYVKAALFVAAPDLGRFIVLGLFAIVCLGIAAITAALHAALERTQQLSLELARLRASRGAIDDPPRPEVRALPPP
jgi:hypothetical protein